MVKRHRSDTSNNGSPGLQGFPARQRGPSLRKRGRRRPGRRLPRRRRRALDQRHRSVNKQHADRESHEWLRAVRRRAQVLGHQRLGRPSCGGRGRRRYDWCRGYDWRRGRRADRRTALVALCGRKGPARRRVDLGPDVPGDAELWAQGPRGAPCETQIRFTPRHRRETSLTG